MKLQIQTLFEIEHFEGQWLSSDLRYSRFNSKIN